ncbi:unnamed protein product [Mycena citricolor]|uniref:Vacuolar protein sorting-associated protein 13 second N-terminal domain-containing protein n=1 Tax=Mycena citricolor TaxID=2018698 RepID=A0AAD2K5I2_9AGAR|nr:unnamed protein product [Mycena citricolor]
MPMPRLLKKLSSKSLHKQSSSTSSAASVPPLPSIPAASVAAPPEPQDALSKKLNDAWASASADPKANKADQMLKKVEDSVTGAMDDSAQPVAFVQGVETGLDAVGAMQVIEKGLSTFMEGMPVLMSALDEVAKLHPFIGVAVMAFKAVWALEQKRRDNDRKIVALHMEMKDMMGALLQMRNVKDADQVAPDGSTIKGRVQVIAKETADDIKACANACDTYIKKKLIVKILKGPIWDGKLVAFAGTFTKRRSEFEFALSIHTAVGVDVATKLIGAVDHTTTAMNAKMDMMLQLFKSLMTPEQEEMARMIDRSGGHDSVVRSDRALQELSVLEEKITSSEPTHVRRVYGLDDLKDELESDPQLAIDANKAAFSRKLDVQTRQIIDDLSKVIEREGDRVISAINTGPHDRIMDPNVYAVWKDMGWRGSVKTRHFVMALRDHFQEQAIQGNRSEADKADAWALEYFNVLYLQPISEAFDDDASGFVTVAEANEFTTSRPLGWSLLRWMAYWAVGHHLTMQMYAVKINLLVCKMFGIIPHILPANKSTVDEYMRAMDWGIWTIVGSLDGGPSNLTLEKNFKSYVTAEEARLRGLFADSLVTYACSSPRSEFGGCAIRVELFRKLAIASNHQLSSIDARDTLDLITGRGRIEKVCQAVINFGRDCMFQFFFPLLYLLLERHFEVLRVCQKTPVHQDELSDAADTILRVFDAAKTRLVELQTIFKQQKLDLRQQFKSFSFAVFEYMNEPNLVWAEKIVQDAEFQEYPYNEAEEAKLNNVSQILNYPLDQEELDEAAYAIPAEIALVIAPLPGFERLFSAAWHGYYYFASDPRCSLAGMLSFTLLPNPSEGTIQHFTASDRANNADFTIEGQCDLSTLRINFKRSFRARLQAQYYHGTWDPEAEILSGSAGFTDDPEDDVVTFVFRRLSPRYMAMAPTPAELQANRPRALWRFAIEAVLEDIRRERWSWSYFKERRNRRLRFLELFTRSGSGKKTYGPPFTEAEDGEFSQLKHRLTTADSRFYHSLGDRQLRRIIGHDLNQCDVCGGRIGGARIICLECEVKKSGNWNTVDFHDLAGCMDRRVKRDDMEKPHLPHHDVVKFRRFMHYRQFGKMYRDSKTALAQARAALASEGSLPCRVCATAIVQPCWFCVQCYQFICWGCDAKGSTTFEGHSFDDHDLVRVQEKVQERTLTVEQRICALQSKFSAYEDRFQQVEGDMVDVKERLRRIEANMAEVTTLLKKVLGGP